MTLVQLRHFIELARHASFSRAAEALHLTQPALSRSILALEDELGAALFDRSGRRCELTAFGEQTLARARQLVQDAEALRGSAAGARAGRQGRLRVGLGSGPGAMLMGPLLAHGAAQGGAGRLQLEVLRADTPSLVAALRERSLDALVVDARSLPPAGDLQVEPLAEMRAAFMVRPGHPLLAQPAPLRFAALQPYPVASTPLSDEVGRLLVERYGPDADPQRCVALRCSELASLVEVARRHDAVLLAIRAAAPDLVELPLAPPLDARARFALVTRAGRSEAPALPLLRQLIGERLRDDTPGD